MGRLGAVRAGAGHPEGCRHPGDRALLLGGQLVELGKQVSCFIASHSFFGATSLCVRAK